MEYVYKTLAPLVKVLRKVEGDHKATLPSIYHDMQCAMQEIKAVHNGDVNNCEEFWRIIQGGLNNFINQQHAFSIQDTTITMIVTIWARATISQGRDILTPMNSELT